MNLKDMTVQEIKTLATKCVFNTVYQQYGGTVQSDGSPTFFTPENDKPYYEVKVVGKNTFGDLSYHTVRVYGKNDTQYDHNN